MGTLFWSLFDLNLSKFLRLSYFEKFGDMERTDEMQHLIQPLKEGYGQPSLYNVKTANQRETLLADDWFTGFIITPIYWKFYYPRDAMLAPVIEIATCLSVCLSVRHAPVLCQNEES